MASTFARAASAGVCGVGAGEDEAFAALAFSRAAAARALMAAI